MLTTTCDRCEAVISYKYPSGPYQTTLAAGNYRFDVISKEHDENLDLCAACVIKLMQDARPYDLPKIS